MPEMTAVPSIRTPRFELVSMSLGFMRALREGDTEDAATTIGATVPADMSEDLQHFLEYRIADLTADPNIQPWLGRVIVLDDAGVRRIIGSIGFHAPPDEDGRVEIGYRVEPEHRRQGRRDRGRSRAARLGEPGARRDAVPRSDGS